MELHPSAIFCKLFDHALTAGLASTESQLYQVPCAMEKPSLKNEKNAPQKKTETVAFLRNATLMLVDSFNKRQFDAIAPPWSTYCDKSFISGKTSSVAAVEGATTSLEGHVEALRQLSIRHPESRHRLVEVNVVVDMTAGEASVHGIVAILDEGAPPRQSIGMLEWKRFDGKWLCIKHVGLQGMAGESLVGGSMNSINDWESLQKWR